MICMFYKVVLWRCWESNLRPLVNLVLYFSKKVQHISAFNFAFFLFSVTKPSLEMVLASPYDQKCLP